MPELRLRFEEDDDPDRNALASGEVDGARWRIRLLDYMPEGPALLFWADEYEHGQLAPPDDGALAVAVNVVGTSRLVWGLAPGPAVAVRATGEDGSVHEAPTIGREVSGSAVFAIPVPAGVWPSGVTAVDRHGARLTSSSLAPQPADVFDVAARIDVRPAHEDAGPFGTVVAEGSAGDTHWRYTVARLGEDLHHRFETSHGTGGSGGGGPRPRPRPARLIGLCRTGGGSAVWHLNGWADVAVERLVLHLRSGEAFDVPLVARELDLGVLLFAVALPVDARPFALDGHDGDGRLLDRCWLSGALCSLERRLIRKQDEARRALEPVPEPVAAFWQSVVGRGLAPPRYTRGQTAVDQETVDLDVVDPSARWPVRPLFVPSWLPVSGQPERWRLTGYQLRGPMSRSVGFTLVLSIGSPGDDDLIELTQGVSWTDPPGHRDPDNTDVRGRPARLEHLTLAENRIDDLSLSWREELSSPLPSPLQGIGVTLRANPRRYDVDDIKRVAEALRTID